MAGELLGRDGYPIELGDIRLGRCIGCPTEIGAQRVVPIAVRRPGAPLPMDLCGACLAEGVAILLGRRHVAAGGELGDLSQP